MTTEGLGNAGRWGQPSAPAPASPSDPASPLQSGEPAPIGYDEFARNLITEAITTDRVAAVIAGIAGDRIEVGPLHFGPRGAVSATGVGIIGPVTVDREIGSTIHFDATVPGHLTIDLRAGQHRYRYLGTVVVPLRITVQPAAPVLLILGVEPIRPSDVKVRLNTSGISTFILQTIGDADTEVAAQVAEIVNDRARSVADLCRLDVATLLDEAWDRDLKAKLTALRDR